MKIMNYAMIITGQRRI